MRKEDLTVPAIFLEAFGTILGLAYIGLQIFYGIMFYVSVSVIVRNILVAVLVYAGLSILSCYPEKINGLAASVCTGKLRVYSIRMLRSVKIIFAASLLIPCICDVVGYDMQNAYSLIVIGLILIIAFYYEYKIIKILRENHK